MRHAQRILAGSGLVLAALAVSAFSLPTSTAAYTLIGGSLGLAQRDFRVFNNFTDGTANNNTVAHANFPGATGAVMAIWKGHVEWGSGPYANNGLGDGIASNPVLGDGGANFDNSYQGKATGVGTTDSNVHSEIASSSGSTLAYTETPIGNGWRIRYLASWTWQDGPGSVTSGIDLQGVACHEIGHSLGLGHSTASGSPTMYYAVFGTGAANRSIETDDKNGIKAIYGAKSGSKPKINGLSGSFSTGGTLVISGSNFSSSGNEVWFTKASSDGNPVKVTGVASSGSTISVVIPSSARDGQVLVRNNGTGNANLSDAWPINIANALGSGFSLIEPGLAGAAGVPALVGSGDLAAGSAEGFTLLASSVAPSASGLLLVSLAEGALPLKGGTLFPVPVLAQLTVAADAAGELELAASIPAAVPAGTTIVLQAWFADTGAVYGASATNGLKMLVP
jgi:hypothetical protein